MSSAFDEIEKTDKHIPFWHLEIPEGLLESILLIPTRRGEVDAPSIKVEVKLSSEQVKAKMAEDDLKYDENEDQTYNPSFKEVLIRKASCLLSEMVAILYYSKIRNQEFEWSDLCQTIEVDWTLIDYSPDDGIHFEITTKREINVIIEA